ncbi:Zinc finger protein 26 [Plakobranchus ocellatus]|uniref:Zinc finger protein 26 n=1 Tax=Plakobranchus ocellatus TaxID=259542 RepID=A0AAV4A9E4_9GAST|nr:Zinc finger protein 26 [Plakobranchus ocellatus]
MTRSRNHHHHLLRRRVGSSVVKGPVEEQNRPVQEKVQVVTEAKGNSTVMAVKTRHTAPEELMTQSSCASGSVSCAEEHEDSVMEELQALGNKTSAETAAFDLPGASQTGVVNTRESQNMDTPASQTITLSGLSGDAVNISETFITIETKDGQSSEKIPFSQFFKNVVVDKKSGNFTLNLDYILGSASNSNDSKQSSSPKHEVSTNDISDVSEECKTNPLELKPILLSAQSMPESSKQVDTSQPSEILYKEKSEPNVPPRSYLQPLNKQPANVALQAPRRSSRIPAKNKRFAKDYVNSLTLGKQSSSSSSSFSSSSCSSSSSSLASSSSTSSWNTQLMTLALAAETHKNSPQDIAVEEHNDGQVVKAKQYLEQSEAKISLKEKSIVVKVDPSERCTSQTSLLSGPDSKGSGKERFNMCNDISIVSTLGNPKKSVMDPKNKNNRNVYDTYIKKDDPNNIINKSSKNLGGKEYLEGSVSKTLSSDYIEKVCDLVVPTENSQVSVSKSTTKSRSDISDLSSRSSKRGKKYSPVCSLVKRTLVEALNIAKDTTRDNLSMTTPQYCKEENSEVVNPPHVYYTIMEPKLEPQGHGLLIRKSAEKIDFRVAEIVGNQIESNNLSLNGYPQDRFFSCNECSATFTSTSSWLQHYQSAHNVSIKGLESPKSVRHFENYPCEFCGQKFPFKFMLDIHIKRKRHSGSKHFRCTLCKETFATLKAREEHWMVAHPACSCSLCGKQFTNIVMLRRHIGHKCHGARFKKQVEKNKEVTNVNELMVISPGHKESSKAAGKKLGLKGSQSRSTVNNVTETNPTLSEEKSTLKDKEDQRAATVSSQMRSSESHKLTCQVCSRTFFTPLGIWKHMMEEHHQFYPQGFKERLLERLEKNQDLLSCTENALSHKSSLGNKSKFFVIMNPKISVPNSKLSVCTEEKEFTFTAKNEQNLGEEFAHSDADTVDQPSSKQVNFDCKQCKESFHSASSYREHCSKIHGECFEVVRLLGAFQCNLCSESYPCRFMLDRHVKKHVGKKLLPCTLCGLQFHKIQERRQHWKTVHPGIGCPNCGKMYASIKYLQKHISLNCQDHFPPSQKFLEFQKKQHNDFEMGLEYKGVEKKILRCHLCPKICSSVHGWRRHMSDAHEDVGFSKLSNTCIICGQLVYGYKALEKHLLEKHAEDSGLPVDEENNLVEEALKKSETDIQHYKAVGRDTSEISQDEFGNYQCPSCPKTHPELRAIKTHMRTHVNMELECSHCGKTFKNPSLLKQHIQRHRKDAIYSCDTCNKSFLTLLKLNKHCKVHHAKGNFVCDLCGASFALNEYLQKHKKCHTDIRPHVCTMCAKTFRTKAELRVHFLIHTRETPYTCQYCGRGFSQRGNYRTHLAQHTGVKPYQCDKCPLSFALKCHLTRHLATHDQLIQYRCLWCDKECTQRKHMQMHVLRVHKEDFVHHEEAMKLDTPTPIPESQARLYNRRPAKASKIRKQYRTRAEQCDPESTDHDVSSDAMAHMIVGLPATSVAKSEPMDISAAENIIHVVDGMVEHAMVSCAVPEDMGIAVSQQGSSHHSNMGNFEVLVNNSEDHQAYTKSEIPVDGAAMADLLLQENMQLVVGENDEISIIIKNEDTENVGLSDHHVFEHSGVHPSLHDAIAALANQTVEIKEEDGGDVSLDMGGLEKQDPAPDGHILNFVHVPEPD